MGYIFSSLVNDGLCDCCDGSDEANNPRIECPNICHEKAREELQEFIQQKKKYTEGIKVKNSLLVVAKSKLNEKVIKKQQIAKDLELKRTELSSKEEIKNIAEEKERNYKEEKQRKKEEEDAKKEEEERKKCESEGGQNCDGTPNEIEMETKSEDTEQSETEIPNEVEEDNEVETERERRRRERRQRHEQRIARNKERRERRMRQ